MPSAGFGPAIPAGEWLQTHALDRLAIGIGKKKKKVLIPENTGNIFRTVKTNKV
jgi:hypothetical protein